MKKTLIKYGFRKCLQVFFMVTVCITVQQAYATPYNNVLIMAGSGTNNQVSVIVAGNTENEIWIDVKIAKAKSEKIMLVIENERGDELYKKEINKSDFSTRFRLQKADNISKYTVVLKSANKSVKESYAITTATKTIEDVTVTKL